MTTAEIVTMRAAFHKFTVLQNSLLASGIHPHNIAIMARDRDDSTGRFLVAVRVGVVAEAVAAEAVTAALATVPACTIDGPFTLDRN